MEFGEWDTTCFYSALKIMSILEKRHKDQEDTTTDCVVKPNFHGT